MGLSSAIVRGLYDLHLGRRLAPGDGELLQRYGFATTYNPALGWRLTDAGRAECARIFNPEVQENSPAQQLADRVAEVSQLRAQRRELEAALANKTAKAVRLRERVKELEKYCKQLEAMLSQAYKYAPPARDETVFRLSKRNAELSQKDAALKRLVEKNAALEKEIVPLRRARTRYKYLRRRIEAVFAQHDRLDQREV